VLYINFYC